MNASEFERVLAELRRIGSDHATCEVKKAQGGLPVTTWETVSAFANAQGGTLILGVDEKHAFAVVGIHDPGAVESQLGSVCSDMEPAVRADIQTLVVDGKAVVIAEIPPIPRDQRPCHKRSLGPYAGSKLRVADGDRRLSDYEVSVLLANRSEQRHDLQTVDGATLADLDVKALDGFLDRIRDTKGRVFANLSTEETLVMLNVVVRQDGELIPTLAGLLAFGVYPQRFEPQLDITIVAYPTTEAGGVGGLGERFTENRSVGGPIPLMVSECIRVLKRNMRRRSIISGLFRQDEWEYPEEVLREVLVNALVHRDYSEFAKGMQVQVEIYPDRLVVRNPGGLYGPVEITALGDTTISSSRNRVLLKILEDTPMGDGHMVCENRGTGIARMRRVMVEAGMEQPRFTDAIATFQAEFPNHTILDQETIDWLGSIGAGAGALTRTQMTALAMMRNGATMTNSGFRAATGVQDSRVAQRELKELVDDGLIVQDGVRGGAVYRLRREADARAGDAGLFDAVSAGETESEGLTALQQQVYETLTSEEKTSAAIASEAGLERQQVLGALAALRGKGLAVMSGKPRSKNAAWRRN
ncbi:MAG: transcriptional regulator [Catenulispora sp.]|nr:transcriptional regulator [Catenulispora sp.]